ncbi:MAG: Bax inhibitor-1 family protein [Campylobacter sp.]
MYIIYDTKNIINGTYTSPIMAAVDMYLNIYNLFLSLLRIFGASRD